jgi:hypothetical protein
MLDLKEGVRLQGNVVPMVAAGVANAVPIFQQSNNPNQIGTRTFRLKRIKGINNAGVNTDIHIGTGVGGAFAAMVPPLHTFNGLNFDFVEKDLPDVEFAADMTCYPDAAGAGTPVTVQVEVEEIG